jgi:hypothetical protein
LCCYFNLLKISAEMGFIQGVNGHQIKSRNDGEPAQIRPVWGGGEPTPKNH